MAAESNEGTTSWWKAPAIVALATAFLGSVLVADAAVLRTGADVWQTIEAMGASCLVLGAGAWILLRFGYRVAGVVYVVAAVATGGVAVFFLAAWWWLRDFSFWGTWH